MDVISRCGPLGVGSDHAVNVTYVMFCAITGTLALYYRSLRTASTLLRRGKISGRPYMGVMTYNALAFSSLKQLGNYHRSYTISFENPKTYKWCINGDNALFLVITKTARLLSLN